MSTPVRLYRAMSSAEAEQTLRDGKPSFLRRWKWFSPYREWVEDRVMGGSFNNSRFLPERYAILLRFTVEDDGAFIRKDKEWALDRRKKQMVKWIAVEQV